MIGNTSKRYTEEFKLMILEMHKKGKTIRELAREYNISPHTVTYWKKQKKVLCQLGGSKSNSKHYEIRN